jgi:catechol 2,3-dioxygenase-like lactoylglutathione lyase family enzyme
MRIHVASVLVDDQAKALDFYTRILGFVKKTDIPVGAARFLTVVSPEQPDGTELLLEPNDNPIGSTFQKGLYESGLPVIVFGTTNIDADYQRMTQLGVDFRTPPTTTEGPTMAVFDDTCGNLIQLVQP